MSSRDVCFYPCVYVPPSIYYRMSTQVSKHGKCTWRSVTEVTEVADVCAKSVAFDICRRSMVSIFLSDSCISFKLAKFFCDMKLHNKNVW